MYCKNCEHLNKKGQKFCTNCGKKLTKDNVKEIKKSEEIKLKSKDAKEKILKNKFINTCINKFNGLSKKVKVLIIIGIVLLIIGLIVLIILLNNPVKKFNNNLDKYYATGNYEYLYNINDIVVDNYDTKYKDKLVKELENKMDLWVEVYNHNIKDSYANYEQYEVLRNKISSIMYEFEYSYLINYEYFTNKLTYLEKLYESKSNYFNAINNADSESGKYSLLVKVIPEDTFYEEAQKFITDYLQEQIEVLQNGVNDLKISSENEEELQNNYKDILKYLNENKYIDNVDISSTSVYKELVSEYIENMANINLEIAKSKVNLTEESTNVEIYEAYKEAFDYLINNSYIEGHSIESEEIDNFYNDNYDKVYNAVMDLAKTYISEFKYEELKTLLKEALMYVNNNQNEELQKILKEYEEKGPINLTSLKTSDTSYMYSITDYKREINDVEYENSINITVGSGNQFVEFDLGKKYNQLKGLVVRPSGWKSTINGTIIIYGDDKELFNSGKITRSNEFTNDINIDVTDVSILKVSLNSTETKGYGSIHVVNTKLYIK